MKTFATAVFLFIGFHLHAQNWTLVSPLKKSTSIVNNIAVPSPSTIYMTDFSRDLLLKSTDGGLSFKRMGFVFSDIPTTLWMFNDTTGILGARDGNFYKTTNGFVTRTTISSSVNGANDLVFTDNNLGYAACFNGSVHKTTNGGNNWTALNSGTTNALKGISFPDANTGYACGDAGTVIKTTNGGQNWQALNIGVAFNLNDVLFADAQKGWIIANGGNIFRSLDGGSSWLKLAVPNQRNFNNIHYYNNSLYVVCDSGYILRSTNDGTTWNLDKQGTLPLRAIGFHSSGIGFVGGDGELYRTQNFGQNWVTAITGIPHSYYNKVSFANNTTGVAVGYNTVGGIYGARVRTTDGGLNWTTQTFGSGGSIAVQLRPDGLGLNGGGGGGNSKTTDFGVSWSGNSAPNVVVRAVWPVNNNLLLLGGGPFNSGIYQSVNGGNTWTHLPGATIYDFHFPSTNIGYAVGTASIRKTTDGGLNWTSIPCPFTCDLNSVFFANDTLGYVSCGGSIAKTTDGGQNWTVLSGGAGGVAFHFFTADSGYSITYDGSVYKTINGGLNWTQTIFSIDQTDVFLLDAAFLANGRIVAVGSSGDIFVNQLNCQIPITAPQLVQSGNTLYSSFATGNQWYNASGPIAGATGNSYTPAASGTYYVIRNNTLGCISPASNSIVVNITSLNNLSAGKQSLQVYPNPAKEEIWVKIPSGNKEKNLLIINSQGQIIRSRPVRGSGTLMIETGRLPAGLYWVKLGNAVGRVVIE